MVLVATHHAGWSPLATFTVASTERYQQNGEGKHGATFPRSRECRW